MKSHGTLIIRRLVTCNSIRFSCTGLVLLGLARCCLAQGGLTIDVHNYGAIGNGIADDTAAINRAIGAIAASGATLSFPCGTYNISAGLTPIQASNVTVTGPSTDCVTLKATGTRSFTVLQVGNQAGSIGPVKLIRDSPANANTFTVTSGGLASLGIIPGKYVLIQNAGWASQGPGSPLVQSQQVVLVTAVSGDTATIEGTFAQLFTATQCTTPATGECGGYIETFAAATHDAITHIAIDGSSNTGSSTEGIQLNYAVLSTVAYVHLSNFLGTSNSGGLQVDTGYKNSVHDITCTRCGNGGSGGGDGVTLRRQSYAAVQNVAITQVASQSIFSFGLRETHFSTLQTVTIDAGGANGRPFKTLRASHNTINNLTATNGAGGHNGISVTDISAYNTFNNCVALSNSGRGIALFGTNNQHNTFNNCTAKYNTQAQLGQFSAWDGTNGDYYTTVNGGTFCCSRGNGSPIIAANSDYFTMSGATISDDQGLAQNGFIMTAANIVLRNTVFSNLPSTHDIYVVSGLSSFTYCGNQAPDGTTPQNLPESCQATSPCDLNGDGATNVIDVQSAVNQAIGAAACTTADLTQGGVCTVTDVQRVVNAVLGGACTVGP